MHDGRDAGDGGTTQRPPVLLVPGAFGQDLLYWNVLQYALERDGFHVYSLTFPRLTLSDLEASAHLLRQKVEEVQAVEDAPHVGIVAHSMGGLISRYYLRFLDGIKTTRVLVCLGTPHKGTVTTLGAAALKGARQAFPGSPFLKKLNGGIVTHGVPIVNIYSPTDFIVLPPWSAKLDGADVLNLSAPLAGHWGMLVSGQVRRWVREALRDPQALRKEMQDAPKAGDTRWALPFTESARRG